MLHPFEKHILVFIFLFQILFPVCKTNAQQQIFLRPYLGSGMGFCYYKIKPDNSDWFDLKKNNPVLLNRFQNFQVGLLLEAPVSKKIKLISGIATGIASYAFTFFIGEKKDTLPNGSIVKNKEYSGDKRSIKLLCFPVNIKYTVFDPAFKANVDTLNDKNHTNKIEIIFGASFNYGITNLNPLGIYPNAGLLANGIYNNDTIKQTTNNSYHNRFGVSANAGITWSICKKHKEQISFTLYYEQGITNILDVDMYFSKNNTTIYRQIGSRGSQVHFNVSVPIKIFQKQR
jgi:hypothetical protein